MNIKQGSRKVWIYKRGNKSRKLKDKQHNGQKKDKRTNNIMPKEEGQKDKQHNGQKKDK